MLCTSSLSSLRYDDEFGRWHLPLRQRNVVGANTCAVAQMVNLLAHFKIIFLVSLKA